MLWISSIYSISTLLTLFLLIKYGTYIPYKFRIYIPYLLLIAILIVIPLLYVLIGNRNVEFYILMVLTAVLALCTGTIQSSIYGLASKMPPLYMNHVISGSAFAGLFISLLRILTKLTIESGYGESVPIRVLFLSTTIYFSCCACLIVVCLVTFFIVTNSNFVKYYTTIKNEENQQVTTSIRHILQTILKRIWWYCLLIFFNFWVTLTVFPGLSSTIPTHYINTPMEVWLSILLNLTFQIYDFVGRLMTRWIVFFNFTNGKRIEVNEVSVVNEVNTGNEVKRSEQPVMVVERNSKFHFRSIMTHPRTTLTLSIALRLLFIPLFILCIRPRLFLNDCIPLLLMCLLSLSNGYFNTVLMVQAPQEFSGLHEKEIAATIMTFFLLFGITVGSNSGLLIGLLLTTTMVK